MTRARVHHLLVAHVLVALLLTACSRPATNPVNPVSQQEVGERLEELALDLTPLFEVASRDPGLIALEQFPFAPGLPFGDAEEVPDPDPPTPEPPPEEPLGKSFRAAFRVFAATSLPRGVYAFDADNWRWTKEGEADVLSLTWPYDPDYPDYSSPDYPDGPGEGALSTLVLDWAAGAPTVSVSTPWGEQVEAPTALNFSLVAGGVSAADVTVSLDYYTADTCGGSILEPTRLAVDGSGTLLTLENVGYSVTEGDQDTIATQGTLTLAADAERLTLSWEVAVNGDLTREPCFSSSFLPESGSVATSLDATLGGEAYSLAFGLEFDGLDIAEGSVDLRGGYLTLDGENALTFSGRLDDRNGNGVPGEGVTVTFADGSSKTLEQLLLELERGMSAFGVLQRFR